MSSARRFESVSTAAVGVLAGWMLASFATQAVSAESLPDPTRPPAAAMATVAAPEEKGETELELRAVFLAEDRRIAVINGRRVGVSDVIAGARVLRIEPGRVRLERAGEILELELVSPAFRNARERAGRTKPVSAPRDERSPDPQGAAR